MANRKLERLMLKLAETHDSIVSEREQGAASALRCANGMATEYWRAIAQTAVDEIKRALP